MKKTYTYKIPDTELDDMLPEYDFDYRKAHPNRFAAQIEEGRRIEEAGLLQKIDQGLSPEVQQRYDELTAKRRAETLTPEEHQELLALIDRIEQAGAKRVQALTELAQLRNVSVTTLMAQLGIRPPAYA